MRRRPVLSGVTALLMAGFFLGACVTALAEDRPPSTGACGPGTAGEIASSKAPTIGLSTDALPTVFLPLPPPEFGRFLPLLSLPLQCDPRWTDIASRAPPLA